MRSDSSAARVRAYRDRLRAQGMRPVQFWVPDTSSPNFAAEAHRQSRLVAEHPSEAADQAFIDAVSWDFDDDDDNDAAEAFEK